MDTDALIVCALGAFFHQPTGTSVLVLGQDCVTPSLHLLSFAFD